MNEQEKSKEVMMEINTPMCPSCKWMLDNYNQFGELQQAPYCHHCGQKLDWSKVK